ncbi:protein kinase domain containing protein [Stylonychia lemnae]|uniref:Protein kinase domain containing protein n=1 Tax=Stylonychia lemnae TaxID=5949 RepID=A0A078A9Q0_STYLE|nr:protein kinase domain containing protein [Stylonychia lemnae]|eukprot:CDW77523.1 protein kinase domain containing protein [Stylonychia lemnae]
MDSSSLILSQKSAFDTDFKGLISYGPDNLSFDQDLKERIRRDSKNSIKRTCPLTENIRIGELLGEGAYGKVYKAFNLKDGKTIAVKVMKISQQGQYEQKLEKIKMNLQKEITLLKNLKHKNIINYLDSCIINDTDVNIYMEYMPGGSISSLIKEFGSMDENAIRHFTRQLLSGLDYLHQNHIIHADLKGANILFDGLDNIKLSDFGAAKFIENLSLLSVSQSEVCSSIQGSLYWMAPEMIQQKGYGRKIDIWSLGCTIIEMATGNHPWPEVKNYPQLVMEIISKRTPPIPAFLSIEAQDFIRQCLQYDKKLRPRPGDLLNHPFIINDPQQ